MHVYPRLTYTEEVNDIVRTKVNNDREQQMAADSWLWSWNFGPEECMSCLKRELPVSSMVTHSFLFRFFQEKPNLGVVGHLLTPRVIMYMLEAISVKQVAKKK
jgi:hypothetical protein